MIGRPAEDVPNILSSHGTAPSCIEMADHSSLRDAEPEAVNRHWLTR